MALIAVGMSSMAVSRNPDDVLVTYSLGSCLGVTMYDPVVKVGGMIHCMMPLSSVDRAKALKEPCMFVDSGVPLLLQSLFDAGLRKSRALVRIAGGATIAGEGELFRIGKRNYAVLRKILWKNGMFIAAEDVGGDVTRTIRLEIMTGRFLVKTEKGIRELVDAKAPCCPPGLAETGGAV